MREFALGVIAGLLWMWIGGFVALKIQRWVEESGFSPTQTLSAAVLWPFTLVACLAIREYKWRKL